MTATNYQNLCVLCVPLNMYRTLLYGDCTAYCPKASTKAVWMVVMSTPVRFLNSMISGRAR